MRAPDYVEPLVGWRVWDVIETDGQLRLSSLAFWTIWQPHDAALARCRRSFESLRRGGITDHAAPVKRCSCGIYATRRSIHALPYLSRLFRSRPQAVHRVVGRVSLWGTVVESTRGWRASTAYPERLFVPTGRRRVRTYLSGLSLPAISAEEIGLGLADYGVPVELVDCATGKELAAALEHSQPSQFASPA
jgi:hypothetical protein